MIGKEKNGMDERGWQLIQYIFVRAVDLPIEAQTAAIQQMCEGEPAHAIGLQPRCRR